MNSSHPPGASVSQTRSFSTVFLIEMWERFGYYGMAALLVLFMIDKLNFTDSHATLTWGAFTALVYASPSIGGWIGDKILGARRTMIFGAAVLSAGYLMLALPNDQLCYHVRVARRDRGRQRALQGERREPRAPHLRRRRRAHRQRVHDLLHGGQYRLDRVDARHAVDQGSLGLARGVRGLLRGHAAVGAELLHHVPHARAYRLRAGRRTGALEARRRGGAGRHRARRGDDVRAAAQGDRGGLRVHGGRRDSGDLRLHADESANARSARVSSPR